MNQTLSMYLGSLYVNSFNEFGRHWQVTVQTEGDFRNRIEDINLLQVRNKWGQMVPLGTLVHVARDRRPDLGDALQPLHVRADHRQLARGQLRGADRGHRPTGRRDPAAVDEGRVDRADVRADQGAATPAMFVFALAVVSVFLALAALYESWSLPLAVILVVPMCLLCSVAGVLYTGREVNIFVQIGLVVLVGLACKNAILIVEYAKQMHLEGMSRHEATREACRLRLRPILMTSFAFIWAWFRWSWPRGPERRCADRWGWPCSAACWA